MIRSICLNPVIDRSYYIDSFVTGRRIGNLVPAVSPGGKGINVAKVCRQCNVPVILYGFIAGANGSLIREYVEESGITARLFETEGNTRETINILDRVQNQETELVEEGPAVPSDQIRQFMQMLREDIMPDDIVICSGISITGAPEDIYVKISEICKEKQAKCFLDTNSVDKEILMKGSYFLYKPNHKEVCELFGRDITCDVVQIAEMAGKLTKQCEFILVSLGEEGGILVGKNIRCHLKVPKVDVVSTIGSGDSSVSGFAMGLEQGMDIIQCAKYAMGCGIYNSTQKGIACVNKAAALSLMNRIEVVKL